MAFERERRAWEVRSCARFAFGRTAEQYYGGSASSTAPAFQPTVPAVTYLGDGLGDTNRNGFRMDVDQGQSVVVRTSGEVVSQERFLLPTLRYLLPT